MPKKDQGAAPKRPNRYSAIIGTIFKKHYKPGKTQFEFTREEFVGTAQALKIALPKNLGDTIYSFRFRTVLPDDILATAREDREWIIELIGRAKYRFRLAKLANIVPNPSMIAIKIPDATPEIIAAYALSDEQALLAKVRYNRLLDIFLGLTTYSLQNHLRTTVKSMGDSQIEIDEVYVGVNKHGEQFSLPVQAKGGSDRLSVVQTAQDIACCKEKFSGLTCRPISAQFMSDEIIAMFELALDGEDVKLLEEKHYKLVPSDQIGADDLRLYAKS
ncbi:MAG: endonuclease [Bryobacteraceae bacterium]